MTPHPDLPLPEDLEATAVLAGHGYHVPDIQSLARDQTAFALRTPTRAWPVAPGISFRTRTVELGSGCFTNAYTLCIDPARANVAAVTSTKGVPLRNLLSGDVVAAVSGSFSFISDDPTYQPDQPCLDFACRSGIVTSLPTITKPAFLIHRGCPLIRTVHAAGTLTIQGRTHTWIGSKEPQSVADQEHGRLVVFGTANCRIRYRDHPRTGFLRDVDPGTNTTPADPQAVDYVVSRAPSGHQITSIHPGGGTDLFSGDFILRGHRAWAGRTQPGAHVQIISIAGLKTADLDSGVSLGPSVADAANGHTAAYDQCLGTSPFQDIRTARTLIGWDGRQLRLQILDGAPLTPKFRGASPQETAELCLAEGHDPHTFFHLDGGQSSKITLARAGSASVFGSLHYLQWPRRPHEPFRWRGLDGRLLHSAFTVTQIPPRRPA